MGETSDCIYRVLYKPEPICLHQEWVESELSKYPGIERVVALTTEDIGRRRVVAYVILAAWSPIGPQHISRYLRAYLPEHMAAECIRVASIPLTPDGEPDCAALLAMTPHGCIKE